MLVAIKIFLFHVVSSLDTVASCEINFVCSNVIQAAFFAFANVDLLNFSYFECGYKNLCPKYFTKKFAKYGHMGICEENMAEWGIPKKRIKKQLRDVDLRSIGYSIEKLWPKSF